MKCFVRFLSWMSVVCVCWMGFADTIVCEGQYDGHLQGVSTDGQSIWWSFTKTLVRTDLAGKIQASQRAPNHQGDLCVKDGQLYVAVNLGRFNTHTGAVSRIMRYDAKSLVLKKTWNVDDVVHGAGGMTWKDDHFYVVGGLTTDREQNYVYEYTPDFTLVKRHEINSGFTRKGIQTAAYENGQFLFGIYGAKGCPFGILVCPEDFSSFKRYVGHGNTGILTLNGKLWTGRNDVVKDASGKKFHVGSLVCETDLLAPSKEYHPRKTNKGKLVLTFDDRALNTWEAALPLFAKYGAHATFFVMGPIDEAALSTMRKLRVAGHSVGLHTMSHKTVTSFPSAEQWFEKEVKVQLDACRKADFPISYFAYPNNRHTPEADAFLVTQGFQRFRAGIHYICEANSDRPLFVFSPAFKKNKDVVANRVMTGIGIGPYYKTSLPDLVRGIRRVAETDETLVFYSHAILEKASGVNMDRTTLETLLAEAQRLGVKVVGFGELPPLDGHALIKAQLDELRKKPQVTALPDYLKEDFGDVCQRAKDAGKKVLVSLGREMCGRCQVFYEDIKRGEVRVDAEKWIFVRLDVDNSEHRDYFFASFEPSTTHLPYVGVVDGDRTALGPCLTGSQSATAYQALMKERK